MTHLRCGGIFSDSIVTNFFLILTVKKFVNICIFVNLMEVEVFVPQYCQSGHINYRISP